MSQISQLESEINGCRVKIQELKVEQENLEEARRQNGQIANQMQGHVSSRRGHAGKFHEFNNRTTISKLIAGHLENVYSSSEETKLLGNYDEIGIEIGRAIQKIEEEIEEQNSAITAKQRRIEEIREEERRERERQERERQERERQERERRTKGH